MPTVVMRLRSWIFGAATGAALVGCSARGPLIYQMDADALYDHAMSSLQAEDWDEAIRSLVQITTRFPSDPRIQAVRFQLGNAYFGKEEYISAAAEYVRLATDFPSGEYADDARFKTCEAYYRLSPKPQLDQQYTQAAIEHCEALISYFPQSEFTPKARALVQDLYDKLAHKALLNGEYYFKRHAFDSSIIYFEELLRRYPTSKYAPKALLRLVQTYQRLGYEEELEAAKQRLLRDFPDTAEAVQAREITLANGR
ncbi:MAG TPA: outer membrane protein assembly factor BamD [Longimicrobiales bacterium]